MKFKFKRSVVIAALLAVEFLLLVLAVWEMRSHGAFLYTLSYIINVAAVLLVIYGRDRPTYKLTWSVLILSLPVVGILLYCIAGTHFLSHSTRRRLESSQELNRALSRQDPSVLERLAVFSPAHVRQAQYICAASSRPVYVGTTAQLLTPGERMFEALLNEISHAEHFILLEFFIISAGRMWDDIFHVLRRKAAEGVEVRVIYDDMGSIDYLPRNVRRDVEKAGIRICSFNPFVPVLSKFMNYRDHRKIVVVDGRVGITGGINIGDEYINLTHPHGYWKDTSILLRGDAVWSMTVMFMDMWHMVTGEMMEPDRYRCAVPASTADDGFVQPYDDCPVDDENVCEWAYLGLINSAKRYLYITTPYLIIDDTMQTALCLAAKSGVDVRITTPYVPDKWYVHRVTRSHYARLLENGVRIYEYLPGFVHSKTCVCDDITGIVGSVNFDYRSFYQQFECAVWLCGCSVLQDVKQDFMQTLASCREINPRTWNRRSLPGRILERFMQLFEPLM